MKWVKGNIWIEHKMGSYIVIPTNAGWKGNGDNIMGAGLAKDAMKRFPELPRLYGAYCQVKTPRVVFDEFRLILVPSKPLNEKQPWLSWQGSADYETVKKSLQWLQDNIINMDMFIQKIFVPVLGTGNGRLIVSEIIYIMDAILTDQKFIGITND